MACLKIDRAAEALIRLSWFELESACLQPATQVGANLDGGEIEHDYKKDEEKRGSEDHGLGSFGVRGLKAQVEDMESEVHELAFGMDEWRDAVNRE